MTKESVAREKEKQARLDAFGMGVFLVVLGAGTLLAAWLLFQEATKKSIVDQFATAARQGDIHVLNEGTDWTSVRNWLKSDLKMRHKGDSQNTSVTNKPQQVDEIVDYYVRPENLPSLLYYYNENAGHVKPEAFVREVHFTGLREITVEIGAPPQLDKPWMNSLAPVRAIFELEGSGWKLKRLDAPDYLIPTQAPTASFIKKGT